MIQKQQASQIQIAYQVSSILDIVEQIIRIKHHNEMIDNRHQRIFLKYFSESQEKLDRNQMWAQDILLFADQKQHIKKVYKMQQIIKTIRESVLNRVKVDHIAPILRANVGEDNIIFQIKKWNRALIQLPQSKTMNTQSSQKYEKSKIIINQNLIVSRKPSLQLQNYPYDTSSETISKVTQDLSKMLKDVYYFEEKTKILNVKFARRSNSYVNIHKKNNLKHRLEMQNISAIRCNTQQHDVINLLTYQHPSQHYGLKKPKRINSKSNDTKIKKRTRQIDLILNKMKRKTNYNRISQSEEKLQFIPLTPKPMSTSKIRQGWGQASNKCSRYSLNQNKKNIKLQKQQKSPVQKKKSPYKSIVEQKYQSKNQKQKRGKLK